MTSGEQNELKSKIKEVTKYQRILLLGGLSGLMLPLFVFFYQKEDFIYSIISVLIGVVYLMYKCDWKSYPRLKRDLEQQFIDSTQTTVTKIHGRGKDIHIRTKDQISLDYGDLERLNVSLDLIKTNSKLELKYARHSRHIFQLKVLQ